MYDSGVKVWRDRQPLFFIREKGSKKIFFFRPVIFRDNNYRKLSMEHERINKIIRSENIAKKMPRLYYIYVKV
jgi:hypothetical protein